MGSDDFNQDDSTDEQSDADIFFEEMSDVAPGRQDKIEPARKPLRPIPRQSIKDRQQVKEDMLQMSQEQFEIETGEELSYASEGLQLSVIRKLRKGNYPVEAELDLHGYRVAEAGPILGDFLSECRHRGIRCVRIIHGKGHGSHNKQPVLKHQLNNWLRRRNDVLAFCSARPYDGGTGAIYLLIRR